MTLPNLLKEYVFDIPNWQPTPLNQLLGHWANASKLKKIDREIIWGACLNKIPSRQIKRSVELLITLAPKQRAADVDAYWKSALDGLVHVGAIWNDNDNYCELLPVKFQRGERKATRIIIRDLV